MYVPLVGNRWSLFDDLHRLQREANRLFGGIAGPGTAAGFPLLNVQATKEEVVVTAEVPGIDPKDIELNVQDATLTISGSRPPAKPAEGECVHRQERFAGAFARVIDLPCRVDAAGVKAAAKNGVLTVRLPRRAEDKPTTITVTTA